MARGDTLLLPSAGHCVPMPVLSLRMVPRVRPVGPSLPRVRRLLEGGGVGLDVVPGSEAALAVALADLSPHVSESLFVTATVATSRSEAVLRARVLEAARRLRRPVLDLVLLGGSGERSDALVASWRTLLALRDDGRVRAVGTWDADAAELALLMDSTGEAPALNEVEVHPYRPRTRLRAFHAQHGIATRADRPLAPGTGLLHDPVVHGVALAAGATPAQVLLAWQWAHGDAAVTTVERSARLAEQGASRGLVLTPEALADLDALDRGEPRPGLAPVRDLRDLRDLRDSRGVPETPGGRQASERDVREASDDRGTRGARAFPEARASREGSDHRRGPRPRRRSRVAGTGPETAPGREAEADDARPSGWRRLLTSSR